MFVIVAFILTQLKAIVLPALHHAKHVLQQLLVCPVFLGTSIHRINVRHARWDAMNAQMLRLVLVVILFMFSTAQPLARRFAQATVRAARLRPHVMSVTLDTI